LKIVNFIKWIAILLVFLWVVYGTNFCWEWFSHSDFRKGSVSGIDEGLILDGLDQKRTFLSTLDWWRGPWCGQVPFFRPITSQLFWLQDQLFGRERFDLWTLTSLGSHIIATGLGYLALLILFRSKIVAAGTVVMFAGPPFFLGLKIRSFVLINDHYFMTLPFWKNAPEYWLAIALFATILAFLARRYYLALIGIFIAIGVKETGFATLPCLMLIAWYRKQQVPKWFWLTGLVGTIAVFFWRWQAIGSLGYSLGSNRSWLYRMSLYYGGEIGNVFFSGEWPTLIAGIGAGLAILLILITIGRKSKGELLGAAGIFLGSWLLAGYIGMFYYGSLQETRLPFDRALVAVIDGNWRIFYIAFNIELAFALILYRWRDCLLICGLVVLFSIGLYTAAQPTKHAWYLADFWGTAVFWIAISGLVQHFISVYRLDHPRPSGGDFFEISATMK